MIQAIVHYFQNIKLLYTVLIGVSVGILLPVIISGIILVNIEIDSKTSELKTLGNDIQATLSVGLKGHLWDIRQDLASELVKAVFTNESVQSIEVYDYLSNKVFTKYSKKPIDGANIIHFESQILYDNKPLGILKIDLTDYYMIDDLKKIEQRLFIIFILQLIFTALFILVLLYWKILKPLTKLNNQADAFSQNDLTKQYIWEVQDEIGIVGSNFENARYKLLEADNLKKDYNERLHNEVELKTEELRYLNETLELRVEQEIDKNKKQNIMIQHNARLAALGEMIQNIAHQWRQPLNGISMRASSMKLKNSLGILESEDIDETADGIVKSAMFLSDTIEDFRNFLKKDLEKKPFIINEVIKDIYTIIKHGYESNNIKINLDMRNISIINGFRGEFSQVILNIFNNSRDILIEKSIKDKVISLIMEEKDDNIYIEIHDNGGGIPLEIIDKVFDPYFTTKHQSQGTGIGLYMCSQIIKEHFLGDLYAKNTNFNIEDKEYFGATFLIKLPLDGK
ncbi:MAG: hypothetical protein HY307_00440 [Arcobacter sp.]|nr:hypothetical protein [Arcobacter sp.]